MPKRVPTEHSVVLLFSFQRFGSRLRVLPFEGANWTFNLGSRFWEWIYLTLPACTVQLLPSYVGYVLSQNRNLRPSYGGGSRIPLPEVCEGPTRLYTSCAEDRASRTQTETSNCSKPQQGSG